MTNETFASSIRNKLGPMSTLIQVIKVVKPVSFNVAEQQLFERSVKEAEESFDRIMETVRTYEKESN